MCKPPKIEIENRRLSGSMTEKTPTYSASSSSSPAAPPRAMVTLDTREPSGRVTSSMSRSKRPDSSDMNKSRAAKYTPELPALNLLGREAAAAACVIAAACHRSHPVDSLFDGLTCNLWPRGSKAAVWCDQALRRWREAARPAARAWRTRSPPPPCARSRCGLSRPS